jgi:phosphatidylserine decarboxylase
MSGHTAVTEDSAAPLAGPSRRPVEPLDRRISTIQPGGGWCMRVEVAWGYIRRWLLKALRPGYVRRMQALRRGDRNVCPHEVLDPRDVKFYRNQDGYWWAEQDDPFAWRDHLPLVRVGLAEVILLAGTCLALAALAYLWRAWAAVPPLALGAFVLYFFRNPRRIAPAERGVVVAPADGRITSIRELDHDPYVGGRAIEIGIFLSVFDVHINRVPVAARVIGMTYRPGKFLNALLPASARENEQLEVRLEELTPPYRPLIVRQIAGAIARRIVCWVPPGAELDRGEAFGMIKLGSRTELVLPRTEGLEVVVRPGDRVRAGWTVLARWAGVRSN